MRRLFFIALAALLVLVSISVVFVHARLTALPAASSQLVRVPNSAYKYQLCGEAYAFEFATPDNPYKTDDTFSDPFRHANDTIIPQFAAFNYQDHSISFNVQVVIGQVATFNETIAHIHSLDGISVLLPDTRHRLQRSSIPQFIVSSLQEAAGQFMAVLDFTCPDQWVWSSASK